MNALLSFLTKSGGGLLREGIEAYIGGVVVRKTIDHIVRAAIVYLIAGALALAAVIFFYIYLYRAIAARLDDATAAAILCGANILAVAALLIGRRIIQSRAEVKRPRGLLDGLAGGGLTGGGLGAHPLLNDVNLDAGIALGMEMGKKLRKAAPQIALTAGIIGLIIGVRPELLKLFGGGPRKPKSGS